MSVTKDRAVLDTPVRIKIPLLQGMKDLADRIGERWTGGTLINELILQFLESVNTPASEREPLALFAKLDAAKPDPTVSRLRIALARAKTAEQRQEVVEHFREVQGNPADGIPKSGGEKAKGSIPRLFQKSKKDK